MRVGVWKEGVARLEKPHAAADGDRRSRCTIGYV